MTDSARREPTSSSSEAVEVDVTVVDDEVGVDPADLSDADLIRELRSIHRTRLDTLRHGSDPSLANHLRRTAELETEYLARHPGREIDPARMRDGEAALDG